MLLNGLRNVLGGNILKILDTGERLYNSEEEFDMLNPSHVYARDKRNIYRFLKEVVDSKSEPTKARIEASRLILEYFNE